MGGVAECVCAVCSVYVECVWCVVCGVCVMCGVRCRVREVCGGVCVVCMWCVCGVWWRYRRIDVTVVMIIVYECSY